MSCFRPGMPPKATQCSFRRCCRHTSLSPIANRTPRSGARGIPKQAGSALGLLRSCVLGCTGPFQGAALAVLHRTVEGGIMGCSGARPGMAADTAVPGYAAMCGASVHAGTRLGTRCTAACGCGTAGMLEPPCHTVTPVSVPRSAPCRPIGSRSTTCEGSPPRVKHVPLNAACFLRCAIGTAECGMLAVTQHKCMVGAVSMVLPCPGTRAVWMLLAVGSRSALSGVCQSWKVFMSVRHRSGDRAPQLERGCPDQAAWC